MLELKIMIAIWMKTSAARKRRKRERTAWEPPHNALLSGWVIRIIIIYIQFLIIQSIWSKHFFCYLYKFFTLQRSSRPRRKRPPSTRPAQPRDFIEPVVDVIAIHAYALSVCRMCATPRTIAYSVFSNKLVSKHFPKLKLKVKAQAEPRWKRK